jgi:hypothetical protein
MGSAAQTSPELIFHIINMSQDSSVSLSVNSNAICFCCRIPTRKVDEYVFCAIEKQNNISAKLCRKNESKNNTNSKSRNAETNFGLLKKHHALPISKEKVYNFVNEVLMIYSFSRDLNLQIEMLLHF